MTYLQSDSRRNKHSHYFIVLVVSALVILGFFSALRRWAPNFTASLVFSIAQPLQFLVHSAEGSTSLLFSAITSSRSDLVAENNQLKSQVAEQAAAMADRDVLAQENESLREMLNHPLNPKETRLAAALITRPPLSPYDTFIIDAGADRGLKEGDIVYAAGTLAVGTVTEVFTDTSRITLFSSSGQSTNVLISEGSTTVPAVAEGLGGGGYRIKLPQNAGAAVGDVVTTSHFSPIVLGTIDHIDGTTGDAFLYLYFQQPINVNNLRLVSVAIDQSR
ncbi:MAG: rod shape-determining protein MreC [Candidatus Pacebacteria bacterium]|nr:rod shape-determining protein MreC [Candidatus Paceibacterota bacterium]